MAQHLIPSAATLRAIKPGDNRHRLSDGAGLYLLLFVKGGSHGWRPDYTFQGDPVSPRRSPRAPLGRGRVLADSITPP